MRAQDVLPDDIDAVELGGVTVRKGTVGAFLANAKAFQDPALSGDARDTVLRDIAQQVPALRALGLFDVFDIKHPRLRALVDATGTEADPGPAPDLDALYAPPAEMIQKAVLDRIADFHASYLKAATFFCLATGSGAGLDASPRGGPAGFVHVLDAHTLAFADWPGNNRIESMRNLERDDRVGMLFLFPGLEIFLRINGQARVSTDPVVLARLGEGQRVPNTAIVVAVREVLLHCGKAINRAKLWSPASQLERGALPTVGQMMAAITRLADAQATFGEAQVEQIDAHYDHAVRSDLY